MKALYVPVAILAVILSFSLWTGRYVDSRVQSWQRMLEETDRAAQREDWEQAETRLKETIRDWEKSSSFLHTLMKHDELDEAEDLFAGTMAACQIRDRADFHKLLAQLMSQLGHLAETQALNLQNIL